MTESSSFVSLCSPVDVFNLSLFDSFVVVDCRPTDLYKIGHLATSVSCPPPAEDWQSLETVLFEAFCKTVGEYLPENFSPLILVFDQDETNKSKAFVTFLGRLVEKFRFRSLEHHDSEPTVSMVQSRLAKCYAVWLLDFGAFASQYPTLCDPALKFDSMPATPRHIASDLFTCSRSCAVCARLCHHPHCFPRCFRVGAGQAGFGRQRSAGRGAAARH